MLKKISIAAVGAALMTFGVGEAVQAAFSFEVIASGLESPRGLTFGPDGALYVAEAGRGGDGPCISTPTVDDPSAENCYGRTSAVKRIQNGIAKRVFTGLPSLARSVDGGVGDATGASDIAFDASGRAYVVLGFVSGSQSDRDQKLGISDFGHLIALSDFDGTNSWSLLADLSAFESANNSDGGNADNGENPLDSNPYDLVIQDGTAFVIDAAANALVRVAIEDGEIALESVFRSRFVNNPFAGPNSLLMQSVPTSITVGPDNAFYVGEFTGFPYPKGEARIYRITSGNEPQVYIEGFTNIIDLAFDSDGNLYVLEYATNSLLSDDSTGALIRVSSDGTRTNIDSGQLIFPSALAIDSDNAIYVANRGFSTGFGEVIRIQSKDESTSVPEPSSILALLALGGIFLGLRQPKSA